MKLNLKKKLILQFVLMGLVPMAAINFVSYTRSRDLVESMFKSRMDAISKAKQDEVTHFFESQQKVVETFSRSVRVQDAVRKMSKSFYNIEPELRGDTAKVAGAVENYYRGDYARKYKEASNGGTADLVAISANLDNPARWSQYLMLALNPAPAGSKGEMSAPTVKTSYGKDHEEFHGRMKAELTQYGFEDLYLITPEAGRVVYSAAKDIDFGTSLTKGAYSNTALGRAFKNAKALKDGEAWFEDYSLYTPKYEAPAAFISAPIYEGNELLGVVVAQMSLDHIAAVLSQRAGLGESGEAYIVGAEDGMLRTDTFRNKDTFTVVNAFRHPEKYAISTAASLEAKGGKEGSEFGKTYDGHSVIGAYTPMNVMGKKWTLFVEILSEEALAGVHTLNVTLLSILSIATLLVGFVGWWTANGLSKRFTVLAQGLGHSSDELKTASHDIAATSTHLSEASTEQAASLQETVASVEEISAMVNQNAEAASKSKDASAHCRREAEEGRKTAGEMMDAIREIKSSNEEILQQMEAGNKEIADIVKVIGAIGEKTKVINDIVFQTKLLSFNASVEAARAGEHGKGFAVVAEEVGNLAQMSGDAAKEISEMLTGSMQKVEAIVERTTQKVDRLVDLGREKVTLGQNTAQKCRDALERILTQVASVNDMVTEIANASREQAQGIQEITKAVNQLDQVTQQNTMASQESSTQADSLSHRASDLNRLVEQLMDFVGGPTAQGAEPSQRLEATPKKNVISLADKKQEKARTIPSPSKGETSIREKKVVGLRDPEVPSSDDPRFEDF